MLPEKDVLVCYFLLQMDSVKKIDSIPYSQRNASPPGTLPAPANGATGGKINTEHGSAPTIGCCESVSDLVFWMTYSTFIKGKNRREEIFFFEKIY